MAMLTKQLRQFERWADEQDKRNIQKVSFYFESEPGLPITNTVVEQLKEPITISRREFLNPISRREFLKKIAENPSLLFTKIKK